VSGSISQKDPFAPGGPPTWKRWNKIWPLCPGYAASADDPERRSKMAEEARTRAALEVRQLDIRGAYGCER